MKKMFEIRKSDKFMLELLEEQRAELSTMDTIENALQDKSVMAFDICKEGQLLGFAMFKKFENGFFLWDYAIDLKYQNRGYGKQALQELIELLKQKYKALLVTTTYKCGNERAKRLYERVGFIETDIINSENIHEVNMILML